MPSPIPCAISKVLDAGRLVVIFPEGTLTRRGHMLPFGRGIERVLKETNTDVPVIPTCTSGLFGGFFSHGGGPPLWKLPRAFRPRVGVWFGEPVKKSLSAANIRLAVQEAIADLAIRDSEHITLLHRAFVRNACKFRNLFRPCIIDNATGQARTLSWGKTFVGALCLTRHLKSRIGDAANIGVWLPTGLGGALANLAIAFLHRVSVNLNYTAGNAPVRSAIQQAGLRTVITSKRFVERVPLELPEGVEAIYLEDVLASITKWQRISTFLTVLVSPGWLMERSLGLHRHSVKDTLTIVFSSGSTGEPKGVILTHRNVGHNALSSIRTIGISPHDRLFGILPFFHSFGYTICLWAPLLAGCIAVYYPDPRSAKEVGELGAHPPHHDHARHRDLPPLLPAPLRQGRFPHHPQPHLRCRETAGETAGRVPREVRRAPPGGLRLHRALAGRLHQLARHPLGRFRAGVQPSRHGGAADLRRLRALLHHR